MTSPTSSGVRSARWLRMVFLLAVICCCSSLTTVAEGPPNPAPTPELRLNRLRSKSFGEQIAALSESARQLVDVMQKEMLYKLMRWVEYLAWLLALFLIPASAVREWHENAGKGRNLLWWFGRLAVCLLLFGAANPIIDALYVVGKDIAEGNTSAGERSVLSVFYKKQQDSFNESYDKLVKNSFTVKGGLEEFTVKPVDGSEAFMGMIYDQGATVRDLTAKLDDSSYTMTWLFALMNISRGVMEAGDLWLIVLAGLLMLTFKMVAPLMVILGIDRKISQRTVTTYIWGLVILTLVWPSVSYIVRILAYMGGNLAMAMCDTGQVYTWTAASQKAMRDPLAQPFYTIVIGSLMMLGAALALWMSPFIAYSIAMGRVFEGVAQQASQLAASIVSTAVEFVSASVGAKIGRQAENAQVQGGYDAEQARNRGELSYANFGAQARLLNAMQDAKRQKVGALSQIWANSNNQIGMANATRDFQNGFVVAQYQQNWRAWMLDSNRQAIDNRVSGKQQISEQTASSIEKAFENGGNMMPHPAVGGTVKQIGTVIGFKGRGDAIVTGVKDRDGVLDKYYNTGFDIMQRQTDGSVKKVHVDSVSQSAIKFSQDSTTLNDALAWQQSGVARASAAQAAGGVNQSYQIGVDTARQIYNNYDLPANQARFDAQMDAAKITRNAGMEAANFRAMQHVLSQVSSKVARDIEKNIEMRF